MKKNIKQVVVVLVALVCGLTANYAYSVFIGPTMNPPAGNPPLPVVEHIYKTDNSTVFYQHKGATGPVPPSLLDINQRFKTENFLTFKNMLSGNPYVLPRNSTFFKISALTPENNAAEQQVCSIGTDGKIVLCPTPVVIPTGPVLGSGTGTLYTCTASGSTTGWTTTGASCSNPSTPINNDGPSGGQDFFLGNTQCTTIQPTSCSCLNTNGPIVPDSVRC